MVRAILIVSFPIAALASNQDKSLPAPQKTGTPVGVFWSDIETASGCFFFCGPGDVGRDVKLGKRAHLKRDGDYLTLEFEKKIRFRGRVGDDNKVRLERQSAHDYGGTWQILQMIEGTFTDGAMSGTYSYSECDTTRKQGCPGRCTIEAHVEVAPAERPSKATDQAIAGAVRRCVEMGLQFNPAFRRAGRVTVRWRSNDQGALIDVGFWENSFADLWVDSVDTFNACVERRMRASQTVWIGTGSFTVKVAAPQ